MYRAARLVLLVSSFLSNPVQAQKAQGFLCRNCVGYASAVQEAALFAPALECSSRFSDAPLQCRSSPAAIVLANQASMSIYPFLVTRDKTPPFAIQVQDLMLIPQQYDNFITALEIIEVINSGIDLIHRRWNSATGRFDGGAAVNSAAVVQNQDVLENCPSGTALDILSDDAALKRLVQTAIKEIKSRLLDVNHGNGIVNSQYVSLGFDSFKATITNSDDTPVIPRSVKLSFQNNELETTNIDYLIFELEILLNIDQPLLTFRPDASMVLDQPFSKLNRNRDVDNHCALARLAQLPPKRAIVKSRMTGIPVKDYRCRFASPLRRVRWPCRRLLYL